MNNAFCIPHPQRLSLIITLIPLHNNLRNAQDEMNGHLFQLLPFSLSLYLIALPLVLHHIK